MDFTRGSSTAPADDGISFDGYVTADEFVASGRRYPIAELADMETRRGPYHPFVRAALMVAALVLFAVATSWRLLDPAGWLGATVLVALPLAVAGAVLRLRPRTYQLWAHYRGGRERLFWTADRAHFRRVHDALHRAVRHAPVG